MEASGINRTNCLRPNMTRSIGVAFLLLAAGAEASLISGGGSSRCSNEEKHMPSMKDMARNHRTTQSSRVGGANADEVWNKSINHQTNSQTKHRTSPWTPGGFVRGNACNSSSFPHVACALLF